jgi:hypothetical protein
MKKFGVKTVNCGSHRFHADPNPTFHFDAEPDPEPYRVLICIISQILQMLQNLNFFLFSGIIVTVKVWICIRKK